MAGFVVEALAVGAAYATETTWPERIEGLTPSVTLSPLTETDPTVAGAPSTRTVKALDGAVAAARASL